MWDAFVGAFVNVLLFIYQLVTNFGIAIILFTILIRLITHPLTASQLKGAQSMQDLQKDQRWLDMQAKYKNDKERLSQEQMKLYKELNINPFASCLPTLIQFPIIIALYQAIIMANSSTPMEMLNLTRHVYTGFLNVATLIPLHSKFLWMDLGQPERLLIPGLGFGIPVMAIIILVTTYTQSKLMQPPTTNPNDQTAMMTNMMNLYMPFLMAWLAYSYASGLALYFLTSNVVGILQYAILGKVNWSNLNPFSKPAPVDTKPVRRAPVTSNPDKLSKGTTQSKSEKPALVDPGNRKDTSAAKTSRTGKPGKASKADTSGQGGRS
jgi:YidC/Oxa1 family membrane protein insertase